MRAFFVQKPFSSYILAEKVLSYEKRARKTLMKLTPGLPSYTVEKRDIERQEESDCNNENPF
jgi:hypothetical protein